MVCLDTSICIYIYGPEHILEESKWDTLIAERQQLSLSGQAVEG